VNWRGTKILGSGASSLVGLWECKCQVHGHVPW
jgi:hypothetical protein